MTAQVHENLIYKGQETSMCTEPLQAYFALGGVKPDFVVDSTALWRGYIGTWEIVNDRLYMVGLTGTLQGGVEATLENIFPGYPDRVFAHWYSGTLRIPEGSLLQYFHGGFASVYERDRFLKVREGVVVDCRLRQNGVAESLERPQRPEVVAMTDFPIVTRCKDDNQ